MTPHFLFVSDEKTLYLTPEQEKDKSHFTDKEVSMSVIHTWNVTSALSVLPLDPVAKDAYGYDSPARPQAVCLPVLKCEIHGRPNDTTY